MNNIELEDRLAKLERCCNEYKSQFKELRERRSERIYEELEERLRRNYEEMNSDLRRTFERIDEQLRQVRPPERAEREIVGNPEFERDADRLAFQLKPYILLVDMYKKAYSPNMFAEPEPSASGPLSFVGPSIEYICQGQFYKKTLMEVIFELYEKTIHVSRLYKLAGNLPLANKYRQDAEKIYTELQLLEDKVEKSWRGLQAKYAKADADSGGHGRAYETVAGPIWNHAAKGRHTLPTSGSVSESALQKKTDGGRKKKTRKNKVLHKR